ncbi:hypothetical protein NY2A_B179L [Paramecium bursaria Chlorella virus NY2A]|uniref:Uncharacterized protein B179L n=1 Tax=Paramecium bursaria Chlorella virus NY2A TaxID=46021 RepID=A7IW54_PBCVN|nr:hypothetical protein NY2A_B179L [Paramecium bursaria Chlorella virus NY2A]ABT14578.1 hypothetical protein NY2A_B179L [Paramecium bursaria Chlorella virus NY2A]
MSWIVYGISKDIEIVEKSEGVELIVDPDEWNHLYIGFTNDFERRMDEHRRLSRKKSYKKSKKFYRRIRNKWNEYDKTILVHSIASEGEAKKIEIELIAKYNSYKKGMNSTRGGDGCGFGADNYMARKIIAYNNSTGEKTIHQYIGDCDEKLGISRDNIKCVLSSYETSVQTKSIDGIWYQFRYLEDTTPFVKNMPTPIEKISGANNRGARKIIAYNNSTGEESSYTYFGECVADLGISKSSINHVLSPDHPNTQARSRDGIWYQFKYSEDMTPFIEDMPTKYKKQSIARKGGRNPNAIPVCAFGKLYDSAATASECLIEVTDTTYKKFISSWIRFMKFPNDVFKVSKEFYDHYKNSDIRITKAHMMSFENSNM